MDLQEGAGGRKFQLGCVLLKGIHSSPRVRDLHLAVSCFKQAKTEMKTLNCETKG